MNGVAIEAAGAKNHRLHWRRTLHSRLTDQIIGLKKDDSKPSSSNFPDHYQKHVADKAGGIYS